MLLRSKPVDELKSFYFQNVMSHLYIVTTLLSAIVLEVVPRSGYWIIVLSSLFPFIYESMSVRLKQSRPKSYYTLGLYLNSIILSLFIYTISFEPSLSGLIILMYTYTLISYGGWRLFLFLFPTVIVHILALIVFLGQTDVIHAPFEIVASSLIASCCFIAVIASYRYDASIELLNSRTNLKVILQKQSRLSKRLSRYLSPKLVETLVNDDQSIESHQRKEVVVFFSDLCDFTSISENMSPEDLSKILNEYLSAMSDIANKYGATIDKFIGDSVMVFFGAPNSLGSKQDVLSCLKMANEMIHTLDNLNAKWRDEGYAQNFKARIGIHQGWATVGNFGAKDQVNYTIIGSTVNIAARLEQNCPPNTILVSGRIADVAKDEFIFESMGQVELKGIEPSMEAFQMKGKHQYGSRRVLITVEANENTVEQIREKLRKVGISIAK